MVKKSTAYSLAEKKVWVTGHNGMIGSAIVRQLQKDSTTTILTTSRAELDLTRQSDVEGWMGETRPDAVFVAAAKVGGIWANDVFPADFLIENLNIATNIIETSHKVGVEKLLYLGSSCIYPKFAAQPIEETALLSGPLEPTNQWYAIAKIAGIKLCQAYRRQYGCDYISTTPTNLYGPGDTYHLKNSHVIPALILKAHHAKIDQTSSMEIWGTGSAKRDFLHADDCAEALVHLMQFYSGEAHVNVGSGREMTIEKIARLVMKIVGYEGKLVHDLDKPDGTPRKLLDTDRLNQLGWQPKISLETGLADAYDWFLKHQPRIQ